MSRKRAVGLMPVLAIAALVLMPAVAQATPQFRINGFLAGATKQSVVQFGTLTLDNKLLGEFKCKVIAGVEAWNESEKGIAAVEAWEPFNCSSTECLGPVWITAESPPELIEKKGVYEPQRWSRYVPSKGASRPNLPWPAELITSEAGRTALNMRKMKLWIICPREGLEVPFTGNVEPRVQNGVKNGLFPSHLVFEGKGGYTSFLTSPDIEGGAETENSELFFSGELTTLGTSQELVTAE